MVQNVDIHANLLNKLRIISLTCIFLGAFLPICLCQNAGIVKGCVKDSATKANLSFATVSVYNTKSNKLVSYQLTRLDGSFELRALPLHIPLKINITYVGYSIFEKSIEISSGSSTNLLGDIFLLPAVMRLSDVSVLATKPLVVYKNDTMQYNVDAVVLPPNSLLEDLLKRLPGLQVENDGKVYFNGRLITRITVEGKDYFLNDPKIATQNLPSSIIENIQAILDNEAMEKNPSLASNEIPATLNLTLKRSAKNIWLGRAYIGQGNDNKYEIGGLANKFKDTVQKGVIAINNNINKTGFTYKNFQDGNSGARGDGNSTNDISLDKLIDPKALPFFGSDQGSSSTTGVGLNINVSPVRTKSFSLQYFFGTRNLILENALANKQFLNDTINTRNSLFSIYNFTRSHSISLQKKTVKKYADYNFKINLLTTKSNFTSSSKSSTENSIIGKIGNGVGSEVGAINFTDYSQDISVLKKFEKNKLQKLLLSNTFSFKEGMQNRMSDYLTYFLQPRNDTSNFGNLKNSNLSTRDIQTALSYFQPLAPGIILNISSKSGQIFEHQVVNTFNRNRGSVYDSLNINLSSDLKRQLTNWESFISVAINVKRSTFNIGTNFLNQYSQLTGQFNNGFSQNTSKILPYFRFGYGQLGFTFSSQLLTVPVDYINQASDSSNQYSVFKGNHKLLPGIQYKYSLNYFKLDTHKNYNYNLSLNMSQVDNDIVFKRIIDSRYSIFSEPVNTNGSLSLSVNGTFRKDIRKRDFQYTYKLNGYINYLRKNVLINSVSTKEESYGFNGNILLSIYHLDKFEFTVNYRYRRNKTTYDTELISNPVFDENSVESNLLIYVSKKFFIESGLTLKMYQQAGTFQRDFTKLLLNTSFSYNVCQQKGQIKFFAYDLLNSNREVNLYINQTAYSQNETKVLPKYFALSFIYNFKFH